MDDEIKYVLQGKFTATTEGRWSDVGSFDTLKEAEKERKERPVTEQGIIISSYQQFKIINMVSLILEKQYGEILIQKI